MNLLQQLEILVCVADNGSFARAADVLGMTRPGVTNAIARLEIEIGARLLHRTTRRTSLTTEGEILYNRAAQLLSDAAEARNLFGGSSASPQGRLRIDVPVSLAKLMIIPNISSFQKLYPNVDLMLGVSDHPADLLGDGVDCVLRLGELPNNSMIAKRVGHMAMVTCGSPEYLEAHGVPKTIDDLRNHRAAVYFSGRNRRTIDWRLTEEGVEREIKMKAGIMVNDSEAFVDCGLAGLGLIQALGCSVEDHLESGRLIEILPEFRASRRPVSIMYPNRQHLSPSVRAFIEWTTKLFDGKRGRWLDRP